MDISQLTSLLNEVPSDKTYAVSIACQRMAVSYLDRGDTHVVCMRLYRILDKLVGKRSAVTEDEWNGVYREAAAAVDEARAVERKSHTRKVALIRLQDIATRKRREAAGRPRALAQLRKYTLQEERADKRLEAYLPVYAATAKLLELARARKLVVELIYKQEKNTAMAVTSVAVKVLGRNLAAELIQQQINYLGSVE